MEHFRAQINSIENFIENFMISNDFYAGCLIIIKMNLNLNLDKKWIFFYQKCYRDFFWLLRLAIIYFVALATGYQEIISTTNFFLNRSVNVYKYFNELLKKKQDQQELASKKIEIEEQKSHTILLHF